MSIPTKETIEENLKLYIAPYADRDPCRTVLIGEQLVQARDNKISIDWDNLIKDIPIYPKRSYYEDNYLIQLRNEEKLNKD